MKQKDGIIVNITTSCSKLFILFFFLSFRFIPSERHASFQLDEMDAGDKSPSSGRNIPKYIKFCIQPVVNSSGVMARGRQGAMGRRTGGEAQAVTQCLWSTMASEVPQTTRPHFLIRTTTTGISVCSNTTQACGHHPLQVIAAKHSSTLLLCKRTLV